VTVAPLLALQALTNLATAPPGPGLPDGWRLERVRGAPSPSFQVREGGHLRVESVAAAGFAVYRLPASLGPGRGMLVWRWRTDTPARQADLRRRERDDVPVRVFVVFDDGRALFYSWGNREELDEIFPSWTDRRRAVVVLRNAPHADGSWHVERRDPFVDYRRAFARAPGPIVAVGVSADMDMLGGSSIAEVAGLTWEPIRPPPD
jgi:hypothetical protein